MFSSYNFHPSLECLIMNGLMSAPIWLLFIRLCFYIFLGIPGEMGTLGWKPWLQEEFFTVWRSQSEHPRCGILFVPTSHLHDVDLSDNCRDTAQHLMYLILFDGGTTFSSPQNYLLMVFRDIPHFQTHPSCWYSRSYLVGGLEHFLFSHVFGTIIPIEELIFFRGAGLNHQHPPTRNHICHIQWGYEWEYHTSYGSTEYSMHCPLVI